MYSVAEQLLDVDQMMMFESLSAVSPPKGRMELVHQKPYVIVDYAHTPDARWTMYLSRLELIIRVRFWLSSDVVVIVIELSDP